MAAWSLQPAAGTQWGPASRWPPKTPSLQSPPAGRSPVEPGKRSSRTGWAGWRRKRRLFSSASVCRSRPGTGQRSSRTWSRSSWPACPAPPIPRCPPGRPGRRCPWRSGCPAGSRCRSRSRTWTCTAERRRGRKTRPLCKSSWWLRGNPTWSPHCVGSPHWCPWGQWNDRLHWNTEKT